MCIWKQLYSYQLSCYGAYKIKIVDDDKNKYDIEEILIFDDTNDIAIITGDFKFSPIWLGSIKNIEVGDKVTAIGSPKGVLNTVSAGVISNSDEDYYLRFIAPISHGSSGGVLLDKHNKVIGITTATYNSIDAQNINFARSLEYIKQIYKQYIDKKYYKITEKNYEKCLPESMFSAEILDDFSLNCSSNSYSVDSLNTFYYTTNDYEIFSSLITNNEDYSFIYNSFDEETKKKISSEYFSSYLAYSCDENCDVIKNIDNWNSTQIMLNLSILSKYEYLIISTDLSQYNNYTEIVNKLNEYDNILYEKKLLILYIMYDYSWNEFTTDEKKSIFEYLDTFYGTFHTTEELGSVLSYLEYKITYNDDGTLTANY